MERHEALESIFLRSLWDGLPDYPEFVAGIRRAPDRGFTLSAAQTRLAVANALRYVPQRWHGALAGEFLHELRERGRIYAYRFRPQGRIWGRPLDYYAGRCLEGRAFQLMMDNNLDFDVALYPYELVTYGETGQVCQNWLQYRLIQACLKELTDEQTLVVQSGHPLGLFHSGREAPRVIITNGLMVGSFDRPECFHLAAQLGVANYGQMTAGGWMYIGPQGIVHGTFSTLVNAARLKLGVGEQEDLRGKLFVSSGLGGMSGAQPKAVEIANGVGIIAEVDESRIETRRSQGWVSLVTTDPVHAFGRARENCEKGRPLSIAFHGNIVDLLEYAVQERQPIDLLSDQTSCHAVYDGGYTPQGLTFDQRTSLLQTDRSRFRDHVDASLRRHFQLIRILVDRGTYFFDYGNAFMKAVLDAGVKDIARNGRDESEGFVFPSYVEDIMGPMLFDYGYGPFRWVCLSGNPDDLLRTDKAAMKCIDPTVRGQDRDNYLWIRDAESHRLVVGTQARILYQDAEGRMRIAHRFNEMVRKGDIGPVIIGRDHHDTGGTDSPFRETANIRDGSAVMAEMAIHCFAGNAARGMSLVALHNGGGVGTGKSVNGGFGLVLDGSQRVDRIIETAMKWDVMGGVARRAWARCPNAIATVQTFNDARCDTDHVTLPFLVDEGLLDSVISAGDCRDH